MQKFNCPECHREQFFDGLCWFCKLKKQREETANWSKEDLRHHQEEFVEILKNAKPIKSHEDNLFWRLLSFHNAITPYMQELAYEKKSDLYDEVFYHAPEELGQKMASDIMKADNTIDGGGLLLKLSWQGGDAAISAFKTLIAEPKEWVERLHVDVETYTNAGGWCFNEKGEKESLIFDTCYPIWQVNNDVESPVTIGTVTKNICPHCKSKLVDIFRADCTDPRLHFLGIDGVVTATICINCSLYTMTSSHYELDGRSELLEFEPFNLEHIYLCTDYEAYENCHAVLGDTPVPLFYSHPNEDASTIGGFPDWIQDFNYPKCPKCGKQMKFLSQIRWDTIEQYSEGTLFLTICKDCQIITAEHQQT